MRERKSVPTIDRVLAKTIVGTKDECWPWLGQLTKGNRHGYAKIRHRIAGKWYTVPAHRITYEHFIAPFPKGLVSDHTCRNRGCVNPWHIDPVTSRENTMRGENIAAIYAKATHCIHGHAFTQLNTRIRPDGIKRTCRECDKLRSRLRRKS